MNNCRLRNRAHRWVLLDLGFRTRALADRAKNKVENRRKFLIAFVTNEHRAKQEALEVEFRSVKERYQQNCADLQKLADVCGVNVV